MTFSPRPAPLALLLLTLACGGGDKTSASVGTSSTTADDSSSSGSTTAPTTATTAPTTGSGTSEPSTSTSTSTGTTGDSSSGATTEVVCGAQGKSCAMGEPCCLGLDCCAGVPVPRGMEFCSNECPISDRNRKTDLAAIDPADILDRVVALPISTWRYREDAPDVRHLGPMAQDFRAAFGLWDRDTMIFPLDATGVSMAAIQALHARLLAAEAENEDLRARLANIEAIIEANTEARSERAP